MDKDRRKTFLYRHVSSTDWFYQGKCKQLVKKAFLLFLFILSFYTYILLTYDFLRILKCINNFLLDMTPNWCIVYKWDLYRQIWHFGYNIKKIQWWKLSKEMENCKEKKIQFYFIFFSTASISKFNGDCKHLSTYNGFHYISFACKIYVITVRDVVFSCKVIEQI